MSTPSTQRPYLVAIDEQADGVAREFTMYEGEVGRCSCGTVFFSLDAAAEHDCSFDDDEIVPESCDADDDSFPDSLTGGLDDV